MMLGARTAAWSGKKLPFLRRVAFLQSHGTEFIDLVGFRFTGEERFVCEQAFLTPTMDEKVWGCSYFGGFDGTEISGFAYGFISACYQSKFRCGYNGRRFFLSEKSTDYDFHVVEIGTNGYIVDSERLNSVVPSPSNRDDLRITLFGYYSCDRKSVGRYMHKCRIKSFKEVVNNTISLIPVLDLSGRPCMFDEVSGQFFYNQGTGEFTWGELS